MIEDNHFTTVIFDYTLKIPLQLFLNGHHVFKIGHPVHSILAKPMSEDTPRRECPAFSPIHVCHPEAKKFPWIRQMKPEGLCELDYKKHSSNKGKPIFEFFNFFKNPKHDTSFLPL